MIDLLFFLFKFAAWLFLLIGTGTMLVGAGYLLHLAWRLKHAQTADGMIVGFVQKTDYWSKVHYLPQVCFTCRGQEYTITSSVSIQAEAYGLGRKVQVFFPPQQPISMMDMAASPAMRPIGIPASKQYAMLFAALNSASPKM